MNTFTERHLGKDINIVKEDEQIWFSAKDIFEIFGLSWRGADSLWQRQIPKDWAKKIKVKTQGGFQNVWFIRKSVIKQIVLKSNKQSKEMSEFIKNFNISMDSVLLRGENELMSILKAISLGFGFQNIIQIQYLVNGYKLDGYIEKFNIVIEYDESSHHYNIQKDEERELEIIECLIKVEHNSIKPPIIFRVKQGQELNAIQNFTSFLTSENPLLLQTDYFHLCLNSKKSEYTHRVISKKQQIIKKMLEAKFLKTTI